MSRSEERQRMKEEDYSHHRGRDSASRSPSRSRSRSRSRGRKSSRRDPRRQKSRSHSPSDSNSIKRERSKSLSRSDSRWESASNTPPNTESTSNNNLLNPATLKQELQSLQSIPTTALSTAEPTQPMSHSIAAIVDSVLPQHPPLHQQPPPTQQTQQPQLPQAVQPAQVAQPEVQPPPQHIQYNIDEGTLRKFCQPYNMEELVRMICNTAYINKEFYDILVTEMKRSSKWCKLFVHGLPWTTTQETLYNVFSRFGQIQECVILKDRNGQSKGYGFINYTNATEAMNAINAGPQQIDGRMVGSDLAWKGRKNRGSGGNNNNNNNNNAGGNRSYPISQTHGHRGGVAGNPLQARIVNTASNGLGGPLAMRRLFVYSLLYTTNDETLHSVFSQFGELEEAVIIKDKTNDMKSKGYGFVIYKNVRDAQKALQQPHKMIDGRTVHCSLAIDGQNKHGNNNNNNMDHHGHGGHAIAAHHGGIPGTAGSGLSALSGLIAQQQAQLAAHPTLNALNTILQAQQQQAALQSYADPYQNVALYQAALGGGAAPNAAAGGAGAGTTQLLQQLLAQQQQLLQSQANGSAEDAKKSAPAPINPGY